VERPEILEDMLDIQEVNFLDEHAFEWGTYHSTSLCGCARWREMVRTSGKPMRILQRQPDGSWKIPSHLLREDRDTAPARAEH
jgi:hypothetical protein